MLGLGQRVSVTRVGTVGV
uniref:Uncharacterized protein n=1 Tax=Moniliophthora roreri TaxID=221103 RepID=A0A0W0F5J2_MONRR